MVLEFQEYDILQAETGESGLELAAGQRPDAVILDINLPGIDGLETCRQLRVNGYTGPVLMLTARHEVSDRVAGLDAGADDYLPKPFALDELLARVRAMLRRTGASEPATVDDDAVRLGDLTLDPAARTVHRADSPIDLTKIEFDLLELLLENRNIVLSRDVIQDRIWGYDDDFSSNSLEVFISTLRKKTEVDNRPRLIQTVRGVGYVAREQSLTS